MGERLSYRKDSEHHHDAGKPALHLVPHEALVVGSQAFEYGAKKYSPWGWVRLADKWEYTQLLDSLLRHLGAWAGREDDDQESGVSHLSHAFANLCMLMALVAMGRGKDDRRPRLPEVLKFGSFEITLTPVEITKGSFDHMGER